MINSPDASQEQLVPNHAAYGMANIRPDRTGLPFVVIIAQRENTCHVANVKVSFAHRAEKTGTYLIAPFCYHAGLALSSPEERALETWIVLNLDVLQRYWDGDIEFTEDVLALLKRI